MNPVIWKYELEVDGVQMIRMPSCAEILHVGIQRERITVWARVYADAELVDREFRIYGTGHAMSCDDRIHIGTVQMPSGLVWHVFDRGATP